MFLFYIVYKLANNHMYIGTVMKMDYLAMYFI